MKDILKMTWKEIEALPKEKTIVFLTFAPVEEHSLHLPLGVDIFLGEAWIHKTGEIFSVKNPDFRLLRLPPLPFAQGSIKGFPGNLYVSQQTVYRVAYEMLKKIVTWGIQNIVIVASHGEPKHLIAIEEACDKINRKYGLRAISPMGAFFSYKELGIDLNFPDAMKEMLKNYPNDFHAGWIETSAILDLEEYLVKKEFTRLPVTQVEEKDMIFPDRVNKKISGTGHIGYPGFATKELGKQININSAEFLYKASLAFASRKDYKIYAHHSLYKIPFLRTHFMRNVIRISCLVLAGIITYIMIRHI